LDFADFYLILPRAFNSPRFLISLLRFLLLPFCSSRFARGIGISSDSTCDYDWYVSDPAALPRARAIDSLSVGPFPHIASFTTKPSGLRLALFSALAIGALQRLANQKCRFFGVKKASKSSAGRNRQTLDLTRDFARLKRRNPCVSKCRSDFMTLVVVKALKG